MLRSRVETFDTKEGCDVYQEAFAMFFDVANNATGGLFTLSPAVEELAKQYPQHTAEIYRAQRDVYDIIERRTS